MDNLRKAAEMALGALLKYPMTEGRAIQTLRQALEQPEQEPVAWVRGLTSAQPNCVTDLRYMSVADIEAGVQYIPLYAAPPKRKWQGLTDEEIFDVIRSLCIDNETAEMLIHVSMDEYRAIEAKLKEKNN